jgi:hypothetical protein
MNNPKAVACPECKASAGFPCLRRSGATMDGYHPEREGLLRASAELLTALAQLP